MVGVPALFEETKMQLARLIVDKEVGLPEHVGSQQVDVLKVPRRLLRLCKRALNVGVFSIADAKLFVVRFAKEGSWRSRAHQERNKERLF